MISAMEWCCEVKKYLFSQAMVSRCIFFPHIYLHIHKVSIIAVSECPNLKSSLDGFLGEVLLHAGTPCEQSIFVLYACYKKCSWECKVVFNNHCIFVPLMGIIASSTLRFAPGL